MRWTIAPPAGTTFGDLLRAIVTADVDLVLNDPYGYRIALVESFKRWGIYPSDIRNLSVENLSYYAYSEKELKELGQSSTQQEFPDAAGYAAGSGPGFTLKPRFCRILDELKSEANYAHFDRLKEYPEGASKNDEIEKLTCTLNAQLRGIGLPAGGTGNQPAGTRAMLGEDPGKEGRESVKADFTDLQHLIRHYYNDTAIYLKNRRVLFELSLDYKRRIHQMIRKFENDSTKKALQDLTGIILHEESYERYFLNGTYQQALLKRINAEISAESVRSGVHLPKNFQVTKLHLESKTAPAGTGERNLIFEVHSLHRAQRVGPETNVLNQVILTLMQRCMVDIECQLGKYTYEFRGGCTVVVNIDLKTVRFINKGILHARENTLDHDRLAREVCRRYGYKERPEDHSPFAPNQWPDRIQLYEPFALLHHSH